MNPIRHQAPAAARMATPPAQQQQASFVTASGISSFLESAVSQLGGPIRSLLSSGESTVHFAGGLDSARATPLAKTQMALTGGDAARAYGSPPPNARFLAGLDPAETYFRMTDMALPDGLQTESKTYESKRGERPDPSTYLDPGYIEEHLSLFDDGAVSFITPWQFETYTVGGNRSEFHGRPEGIFVMPAKWVTQVIENAKSAPSVIAATTEPKKNKAVITILEEKLGIPTGAWSQGSKLLAVLIENPRALNLRMTTGREGGANLNWRPCGLTSGGTPEALVDKAPVMAAYAVPFDKLGEILADREFLQTNS